MASTDKKAVHFGAGNIGRGFVACFLHESGYHVTFADVMDDIVNKLNETPSYKVNEVGVDGGDTKTITNYRAINSKYNEAELIDEIATSEVVTCSVGPNILKFIAPVIAKGIDKRSEDMKPLAVIACENMIGATDALAEHIKKNSPQDRLDTHHLRAAYANSAIDRIVPAQDPNAGLDVTLEQFYEWVVEEPPFNGSRPSIDGIKWTDNLKPFIERKLFTVNTSHATAAYFGYNRKKKTVDDAMRDKAIKAQVEAAITETASIIVKKHGIPQAEQDAYKAKIIKRISNPHLADAVERVGRAPLRKLGRNERFIGPAFELAEEDMTCTALLEAAEMTFRFQNVEGDDESKELATIMAENSAEQVAEKVCGLKSADKLFPKVVEVIKKVQADMED
ncbi:mannitol-1-phosphate 5-dehydrogenase [Microdochium trichocladiopsis]|uniref:Mannitol-1-phosphate 5-dehydrogenase n=1 Tax=Microdochium trichocladiopsis TaxID=1682393 RepID=A0A9P9BUN3_9PEZI|nr:mannitol-1-phosphate 5-dehydrogenase [Microdochium trichocladiopsis]KAH7031624.1 mannitol-1-phosphate 5-dehydrogenase [Microdochium trichocladiopsis]